ncbi:hypothetical protein GGF37_003714 [Kickxella alabastrina]|nr:hypothetical protein GGF37_003714 [Kickxella alabastrina]
MVSLASRLRWSNIRPPSLNLGPAAAPANVTNRMSCPQPPVPGGSSAQLTHTDSSPRREGPFMALDRNSGPVDTTGENEETLWHGSPVFDAGFWYAKGGMDLVRTKHTALHSTVEALFIAGNSSEPDLHCCCLELEWPRVRVIEIECNVCSVESDPQVTRWLGIVQKRTLFPLANMYRLRTRWAGCTEVFEHRLEEDFGNGFEKRLALLGHLPPHIRNSEAEMRFLKYRLLFLADVSFEMTTMERSNPGTLTMYTYIVYLLKTDIFRPEFVEFADAQPKNMHRILDTIKENAHQLTYDKMRAGTSGAALQTSLKRLRFDMHSMVDGRHTIPFCAIHFPGLESLTVSHTPDFRNGRDTPMNLGVLFSHTWLNLVELQLPFVSNQYAAILHKKCPSLQYLHICPQPRYERWTEYSQDFSPSGLHQLATQWSNLRQLVVKFAFRQALPAQLDLADHGMQSPTPPSPRMSFSAPRTSLFANRSSVSNNMPALLDAPTAPGAKGQLPGPLLCKTFSINPPNTSLQVLRVPYLQIPFAAALAMLANVPQLRIFEYASFLVDPEHQLTSQKSTLRRRIGATVDPQLSALSADPDIRQRLKEMKHPLQSMVVHEACNSRYISTSWIKGINSFSSLESVTLVATSQGDISMAVRVRQFCATNNAIFAVEIDDQSHAHQTCVDFASSWEKTGKLMWNAML